MLDNYYGWSHRGHTRNRYRHYFSNDTMNAVLELADGLNLSNNNNSDSKGKNPLEPIKCPNCDEENKRDSRFCANCRFVLSFDAFNETLQERDKTKEELQGLQARMDIMATNLATLMQHIASRGQSNLDLIATDIKGMSYESEEQERQELIRMGEVARAKRKPMGEVALDLDVEIKQA
jgi:hypothetical protein